MKTLFQHGPIEHVTFALKKIHRPNITFLLFIFTATLLATVCACTQTQPEVPSKTLPAGFTLPDPQPYSVLLETSYCAGDSLGKGLRFRGFEPDMAILTASFVNIDNLEQSSTLGRIVSEQIASRLAQHGYKIIEMKLRQGSIFVQKGKGEFLLSRDLVNLSINQGASAVLVGTYAVSKHFIFISTRVVRTEDNSVITGYDYELPRDKTTRSIL